MRLAERLRTRVPTVRGFVERARADHRRIAYDLLPTLGLRGRDAVSRAIAGFLPRTADFAPSQHAKDLHAELWREGLTAPQGPITASQLTDMLSYFRAAPCHDPYRPQLGIFACDAPPNDEVNIGYYSWEQVVRAPHLLELVNHPDILACAELYFGAKPTIDNVGASWSYPGRSQAKGGQRFHRDYDCSRSFKVFLYLTDVTPKSGPHVFVRGSHRSSLIESGRAQSDEDIRAAFGQKAVTEICAPAGSWFLEDVYGFHKGLLPVSEPRLIVAVEYNLYPSPLSPKAPLLGPRADLDPYINRLFVKA